MAAAGLFDGPAPRVRTIPASAPFLETLVSVIVDALPRDDPFALADTVIFLPNRRASNGLVEAFAKRLGNAALLPAIRPLGDLDDDPDVWGPEPLALDVPPEIPPLRRRFELAQLVRRKDAAEGGVADPVRALAWADELCRLLDAAATVGAVDWSKLEGLVEERDLAAHWRRSAQFLEIVSTYWPERLRADGLCDPAERKAILLQKLAEEWTVRPPAKPVIIAGSTGSVAATRVLMAAAAGLPRGCVVLPGLDTDLDEAWDDIDAQHPQHALQDTLAALGMQRSDVPSLVDTESPRAVARRRLVSEALAPAGATADWRRRLDVIGGRSLIEAASQGLSIVEARNEDEEALCIALLLRGALETPDRTAALVTPDAGLAHRVHSKLRRWEVTPQMTVSAPLGESEHGKLVSLLTELFVDDAEPVALLALLKHPLVALGLSPADKAAAVASLERIRLRGPRRWGDLDDLVARLHDVASDAQPASRAEPVDADSALSLMRALTEALAPLSALRRRDEFDLAGLAEALAAVAERLAIDPEADGAARVWSGPLGEATAGVLRDMGDYGADLGALAPRDAPRAVALLLAAREAPPPRGGHPRLAILGPLEARLQRRDLMILGGLVEGVWPGPPPEDAFLSRTMRRGLGLPAPEARTGLAAHDFAQLANAPEVVMTRSAIRDGAPTVASRWLWRLDTLARATGDKSVLEPDTAHDPRPWARAIDAPRMPVRVRAPEPRPPVAARPKRISFTQVETLIRDPYAIYARRVLDLPSLDAPGLPAGARHRGTAIHGALEHFVDGADLTRLLELLDRALAEAGFAAERRRTERARLTASAEAYVAWNAARREAGFAIWREVNGALDIGGVTLSGRADRIDQRGGVAQVIDFKTGKPPTAKEVNSGLAPQLTLEAALLAKGAFNKDADKSIPSMPTNSLIYWRFGGADPGAFPVNLDGDVATKAAEALQNLTAMLKRYGDESMPYLSKPRAQFAKTWADYDHFARRAEWADAEDDE